VKFPPGAGNGTEGLELFDGDEALEVLLDELDIDLGTVNSPVSHNSPIYS